MYLHTTYTHTRMRTVGEHSADGNLARHNSPASNTPLYYSFGTDERIQRVRQRSHCNNHRARASVQPLSQRQSPQPLYTFIYVYTFIRREIRGRYTA